MRIVDPGHEYLLNSLDDGIAIPLIFVKREGEHYPGNIGHHSGTTSQEVLRALIDRADYVNRQLPCVETETAKGLMQTALLLLEIRAARLHDRNLDEKYMNNFMIAPVCEYCGHVRCIGNCRAKNESVEK